jgi:hypothetical protein
MRPWIQTQCGQRERDREREGRERERKRKRTSNMLISLSLVCKILTGMEKRPSVWTEWWETWAFVLFPNQTFPWARSTHCHHSVLLPESTTSSALPWSRVTSLSEATVCPSI